MENPLLGLVLGKVERTRRNHGLEHATVAVLLERFGLTRSLAGRSNSRGFNIFGQVTKEEVESAVDEGLRRMRHGEASLAVSPFCGTNIAVTGALAGLFTLAIVNRHPKHQQLPNVMLGGMLAVVLGQPLGRLMQQQLTTSGEMGDMKVQSVAARGWGPFKGFWVETSQPTVH